MLSIRILSSIFLLLLIVGVRNSFSDPFTFHAEYPRRVPIGSFFSVNVTFHIDPENDIVLVILQEERNASVLFHTPKASPIGPSISLPSGPLPQNSTFSTCRLDNPSLNTDERVTFSVMAPSSPTTLLFNITIAVGPFVIPSIGRAAQIEYSSQLLTIDVSNPTMELSWEYFYALAIVTVILAATVGYLIVRRRALKK